MGDFYSVFVKTTSKKKLVKLFGDNFLTSANTSKE